jgi:hypothetical protein
MTSAECQISDPKGRYLVFTLLFFQMPLMKTQDLNTKIITKKPKNARNCESRASQRAQIKAEIAELEKEREICNEAGIRKVIEGWIEEQKEKLAEGIRENP